MASWFSGWECHDGMMQGLAGCSAGLGDKGDESTCVLSQTAPSYENTENAHYVHIKHCVMGGRFISWIHDENPLKCRNTCYVMPGVQRPVRGIKCTQCKIVGLLFTQVLRHFLLAYVGFGHGGGVATALVSTHTLVSTDTAGCVRSQCTALNL